MTHRPQYHSSSEGVLNRRYEKTLRLLMSAIEPPARVLDLGPPNPLAERVSGCGYTVMHTEGDLDEVPGSIGQTVDVVTAFEILEHLVSPLPVLREINAPLLVATIPMRLWFRAAYRSASDPWDRHYHEFEDWQFDWLLEKSGWDIVHREKWTSPIGWFGFRPLLRRVTPRYYAVVARRP